MEYWCSLRLKGFESLPLRQFIYLAAGHPRRNVRRVNSLVSERQKREDFLSIFEATKSVAEKLRTQASVYERGTIVSQS